MDGAIEDGDFGRDSLGRDDVDLASETSFKFAVEVTVEDVSLLYWMFENEFPERDPRALVYFYNYDGVISDEKFVPLYDEI